MKKLIFVLFFLATIVGACENDNDNPQNDSSKLKSLPRTIYYNWANDGVFKINLPTAK